MTETLDVVSMERAAIRLGWSSSFGDTGFCPQGWLVKKGFMTRAPDGWRLTDRAKALLSVTETAVNE